jgi:hypothetical protein
MVCWILGLPFPPLLSWPSDLVFLPSLEWRRTGWNKKNKRKKFEVLCRGNGFCCNVFSAMALKMDLENEPFVVLGKTHTHTHTHIGRLGFLLSAAWDPTLFVGARPSCCSIYIFGFLLLRQ